MDSPNPAIGIFTIFKKHYSSRLLILGSDIRLTLQENTLKISSVQKPRYQAEGIIENWDYQSIDLVFDFYTLFKLFKTYEGQKIRLRQDGRSLIIKSNAGQTQFQGCPFTDYIANLNQIENKQKSPKSPETSANKNKLKQLIQKLPVHKITLAEELLSALIKH